MKCKKAVEIFDPYSILPRYGESKILCINEDNHVELKIFYDDEKTEEELYIRIIFGNCVFNSIESFPGIEYKILEYEYGERISSLNEFLHSDFQVLWESQFNNLFTFRHFKIFFLNVNKSFEIVAETIKLS